MVFYNLRIIERLWGSRKFAVCISNSSYYSTLTNLSIQSFLLSTLLPTLLLPPMLLGLVLRPLSLNALNILPAGPTAILFALLAQYHTAIPTVYKYRLTTTNSTAPNANQHVEPLSLLLSDKSLVYLLGGQLALSSLPGSLLAAGVGWCVGIAWRSEIAPERWTKWRIPIGFGKKQRERGEHHGFRRRSDGERRGSAVESERENVERRRL